MDNKVTPSFTPERLLLLFVLVVIGVWAFLDTATVRTLIFLVFLAVPVGRIGYVVIRTSGKSILVAARQLTQRVPKTQPIQITPATKSESVEPGDVLDNLPASPSLPKVTPGKNTVDGIHPVPEIQTFPDGTPLVFTIKIPKDSVWHPERAQTLIQSLISFGEITFRILCVDQKIVWQIVDVAGHSSSVERVVAAVHTIYPESEVTTERLLNPVFESRFVRIVIPFIQAGEFFRPIKYPDQLTQDHDPLSLLTNAMELAQSGERVSYLVHVGSLDSEAYKRGLKAITKSNVSAGRLATGAINMGTAVFADRGWLDFLFAGMFQIGGEIVTASRERADPRHRAVKFEDRASQIFYAKISQPLYHTQIILEIEITDPQRYTQFLAGMTAIGAEFNSEYQGLDLPPAFKEEDLGFEIHNQEDADAKQTLFALQRRGSRAIIRYGKEQFPALGYDSLCNVAELASLWHLPHKDFAASDILWAKKQVQIPSVMKGNHAGVFLGNNIYAGRAEPVFLPTKDRDGHIAIVGKVGVGKSNLLHNLIHQDIANGYGVTVIDPHGSLVSDILKWSIPEGREGDVVVLDIANEDYPPPLNLLAVPPGMGDSMAVGQLMAVLEKYGSFEETQTVAPTLHAALMSLRHEDTPTIRDVSRLFIDDEYRVRLIGQTDNPGVQDFWDSYTAKPGSYFQAVTAVTNRILAFYGNEVLYPMLCHPDDLNLPSKISANKIILVSLRINETKVSPSEQRLLGAILVSQLQMAAMGGAITRPPYYLYIDEVEHFATTALPVMFSQSRKFGLSLTVANQYLKQLAGKTLDALTGTIGALIAFECGLDDANALSPYMRPEFETEDLLHLGKYNAVTYMRFQGQTQPAFNLTTALPLGKTAENEIKEADARGERLREASRVKYTPKHRDEVLAWLKERYTKPSPVVKSTKSTKSKRSTKPKTKPTDESEFYDKTKPEGEDTGAKNTPTT
ncbi:MAG: type IV secretory system conjugative DNA transfer family protein [Aggregatilineales bacterium]